MTSSSPQLDLPSETAPRFVVTGAAGFIGRRVVARLAAGGAHVRAVDRMPAPEGFPAGVEFCCVDLENDFPPVDGDFVLVHLAWSLERRNPDAQAASVSVFSRLLEQRGLRGVAGLGSAEEYGEREGRLSEDMRPSLQLPPYGQAKSAACQRLKAWSRGPGRKAIWLRPFIAYGPGQRGDLAIPYALRCARERSPAEFSAGLQFRDFVHVDDVGAGIAQAAFRLPELGDAFTVCNLGCGVPVRLRDVLERIAEKTGSRELFHLGARPMRTGEPREQYADVSAAKRLLGWRAQIPWQRGIDDLCREIAR